MYLYKIWSKYTLRFKSYEHFDLLTTYGWNDAQKTLDHQKMCYTCQWLDNVDMHLYAKLDQYITCGSRVTWAFSTNC